MSIREVSPANRAAVKAFVRLEREFMVGQDLFWPQLDVDVRKQLSGRSAFFRDTQHTLFVADRAGAPVARCAAVINRAWQASHEDAETTGFVGYFAARPGAEAESVEMLLRAEDWLVEHGVRRVVAPFNASALIGMGLLTDAFDESPMFPMAWNPPFYRDYLEAAGYAPRYPIWIFEVDFASEQFRSLQPNTSRITMRSIDKRRWNRELNLLRELWNSGMTSEWEMHRFTRDEFAEAFGNMKFLDARLIQFIVDGDRPIGFLLGMVDMVPLFRSFGGQLGPLKLVRLLRSGRIRTRAGAIGGALLPEYRGRGSIRACVVQFFRIIEEMGYSHAMYYPVNDANVASRKLAESVGAHGRVIYHCFDKQIA